MNLDQAAEFVAHHRNLLSTEGGQSAYREAAVGVFGDRKAVPVMEALVYGLRGRLFWTSTEMTDLLEHASISIPDEPLREEEVPSASGCCMLSRGIRAPAVDCADGAPPEANEIMGWCWSSVVTTGHPTAVLTLPFFIQDGVLFPIAMHTLTTSFEPDDLVQAWKAEANTSRALRAFWTISQQRIASRIDERPSRPSRRRMGKAGALIDTVTVVRLRRFAQDHNSTGEIDVEWSHRWIVSGHWRRQWLPKLRSHRSQWIAPYVKGPDDKPLVLKDRRYALVR